MVAAVLLVPLLSLFFLSSHCRRCPCVVDWPQRTNYLTVVVAVVVAVLLSFFLSSHCRRCPCVFDRAQSINYLTIVVIARLYSYFPSSSLSSSILLHHPQVIEWRYLLTESAVRAACVKKVVVTFALTRR